MPKERRKRRGHGGEQQAEDQDLDALATLSDGRPGASVIDACDAEEETQREEALLTVATLLAGPDRAALVSQPRLGPVLLERANDGSIGVRVAALGALGNLLLDGPVPPLGADPTPLVLKNLAMGLRAHLNIADAPMPKLPGLETAPPAAAGVVPPPEGEAESAPRGEPGFDKHAAAKSTRVALATQAAEVLAALSDHGDAPLHALVAHEAMPLLLNAIHGAASVAAPGQADLEGALARLALLLADAPADLGPAGPPLAAAIAPCLAVVPTRFAMPTRTALAACAAALLADPTTAAPLAGAAPAVLLALSDAMQPDVNGMRSALVPQLAASPIVGLMRGTEEAEEQLRQVLRAQRLALECVANLLVTEDTEAAPDPNAELQDDLPPAAAHHHAAPATQHSPVYLALQAQLVASPLLLPLIARKCVLPEAAPAAVAADMKETDAAFTALLEAALDALLNYLLSDAVPPPAAPAAAELWLHLCQLAGQLVARGLNASLPAAAQCLAALVRRTGAAVIAPTESQLDGLLAFAVAATDELSPFAIELLAALRRALGTRYGPFAEVVHQFIKRGDTAPPACLSAALNATFDVFADDFPAPDTLLASLKNLLPVLTQRVRGAHILLIIVITSLAIHTPPVTTRYSDGTLPWHHCQRTD